MDLVWSLLFRCFHFLLVHISSPVTYSTEFIIATVLTYNIGQAVLSIAFPIKSLPPTPAKVKKPALAATPKRKALLTSQNTPSSPVAGNVSPLARSIPAFKPSPYPPSPLTSPSRVVQYASSPSRLHSSLASSTSSMVTTPSPSPVVSAFRGKRGSMGGAREFLLNMYLRFQLTHFQMLWTVCS